LRPLLAIPGVKLRFGRPTAKERGIDIQRIREARMRTKRTITRGLIWTGLATWRWAFLSVLVVGMFAVSASAATFTVTSTGDVSDPQAGDGSCGWPKSSPFYAIYSAIYPCTLRAALEEVNAQRPGTGPHTINFSIGYGNQTISLTNALPRIMQPVVIDGGTQPVYVRNVLSTTLAPCSSIGHPCIQLNGNGRLGSVLTLAAGNSTVRWLAIYNYDTGISITSDNDLIEASYIGTDASGV